jgi:release factor glutamine methyltransferase
MQTSTNELRREIKVKLTPPFDHSEADQFAALIIEHFFEVPSITQLLGQEINISSKIEGQIRRFCERLLKNEPIQYVLGYTEFYGRQFKTDARALIPRPETEELVNYILAQGVSPKSRIMDIGTGTGCIGITLALEAHCKVFAIDVDIDVLNLARENAAALGAEINFIQADILTSKPHLGSLDIMVSNPPYVPQSDRETMDLRVLDFEPSKALFTPEQSPLIFYQRIESLAAEYLVPGGQLFLEIYHLAGPAVMSLFQEPRWSQVLIKKDLQGKDRMLKAVLKSPG